MIRGALPGRHGRLATGMLMAAVGWLGCSSSSPDEGPAQTQPTTASAAASIGDKSGGATSTSSAPAPAPTASAAAQTEEPDRHTRSGRPTLAEWCRGRTASLGWDGKSAEEMPFGCEMVVVREWALLTCPTEGTRGKNDEAVRYLKAIPAGCSVATDDEVEVSGHPNNSDALVVSLRPGTRAEPTFFYRPVAHPEWMREQKFLLTLGESATSLDDRQLDGRAWPEMRERSPSATCEKHFAEEAEQQSISAKRGAGPEGAGEAPGASAAAALPPSKAAGLPPYGPDCKTPLVFLYDVRGAPAGYMFPQTRVAMQRFAERDKIELVEFDVDGLRRLGVQVPDKIVADALIAHINATMEDEDPILVCYQPDTPRVVPLR